MCIRDRDTTIHYSTNDVTITPTTSLQDDLFTQQVHFPLRRWLTVPNLQLRESLFTQTVKPWKNQTELEKVLVAASAFEGQPGLALTINFSDARRGRLMKDSTTVFRELRNEVSALAKHGPLMMAVETAGSGMLHLHGFLQTHAPTKVIRALMLDIGGRSANVGFRSKQIKVEECHSAICWATYMTKSLIVLDDDVSREQVYFSQAARRVGSDPVSYTHLDVYKRQLYEQGYTIGGARLRLEGEGAKQESALSNQIVKQVRMELEEVLQLLRR